jgi:predicted Zn finger-like uncharacterized protein
MKFHCDRCKTRYSIADDRVRGKILKIRCKNCSAVITVREGMDSSDAGRAEPAAGAGGGAGGRAKTGASLVGAGASLPKPSVPVPAAAAKSQPSSALRGAFQQVMSPARISPSDSFQAPATLDEEWYVSIDGVQSGPFSLHNAKQWVGQHSADDELWCWNEDFDDWLPVEKVSHFRGLRGGRPPTATDASVPAVPSAPAPPPSIPSVPMAAASTPAAVAPVEPTPKPLFDATMERVRRETSQSMEAAPSNGASAPGAHHDPVDDLIEDIDFDIGEASRIVKLPMLLPQSGDAAGAGARDSEEKPTGSLPGVAKIGKGSGGVASIGPGTASARTTGAVQPLSEDVLGDANPDVLMASSRGHLMPLVLAGAALITVAIIIAFVASSGSSNAAETPTADIYVQSVESTDFQFGGTAAGPSKSSNRDKSGGDAKGSAKSGDKSGTKRRSRPRKVASANTGGSNGSKTTNDTNKSSGSREVIPAGDREDLADELTPSDISRVSSRYQMSTTRCYERALKKDPFLRVRKLDVVISVAPTGVVTNLKVSSHSTTLLGRCLQARIRKWKFPKSRKGITTQISIVFQSRR